MAGADDPRLLGDVDAGRAPRDAAPAADAPGGAELDLPGRELVRHPLPVAGARGLADGAVAVDVGVIEGEAAVPVLAALDVPGQVVDVLHRGAEAGGADQRAV